MKQISFAIGTGRCGTKFLHEIFIKHKDVASVHERAPLNDTFHRFCKWYRLDIDHSGFIETKRREIKRDLEYHTISFESSAYLSLSIVELFDAFKSKFILLVRSPRKVIESYIRKGWYDHEFYFDPLKAKVPTFQPDNSQFHHFLGRTLPREGEFLKWRDLTRVGKLAWFWKVLNQQVLEQFSKIPSEYSKIQQIETLDWPTYRDICGYIGTPVSLNSKEFSKIVTQKPNSNLSKAKDMSNWSEAEEAEFLQIIDEDLLAVFGYDYI